MPSLKRRSRKRKSPAGPYAPLKLVRASTKGDAGYQNQPLSRTWSVLSGSMPLARIARPLRNNAITVVLSAYVATFDTTSVALPTFSNYYHILSSFQNYVSYANAFDEYCIHAVDVWIWAKGGASDLNEEQATFKSVIDYDDGNALTSVAQADGYDNCLTTSLTNGHQRSYIPCFASSVYAGAFGAFANTPTNAHWFDTVSTGIQCYGLKTAVEPTAAGAIVLSLQTKVLISFRNSKA